MKKRQLYSTQTPEMVRHTRIDPNSLTAQQIEANLSKIDPPVSICFTEEPHPEVFQRVRSILLSTCVLQEDHAA